MKSISIAAMEKNSGNRSLFSMYTYSIARYDDALITRGFGLCETDIPCVPPPSRRPRFASVSLRMPTPATPFLRLRLRRTATPRFRR